MKLSNAQHYTKERQRPTYNNYNGYNLYNSYKRFLNAPELAANAMICLINQTNQMLDAKLRWLEERFVKEGGFR